MTDKTKKSDDPLETDATLSGRVLIAMPGMEDPRFQRAVIFLCAHDENGAMGLVVNHVMPGLALGQLLRQLHIDPDQADARMIHLPVFSGGPVEAARGFVLHANNFQQGDTVRINDQFSVTGTIDALQAIASGDGPADLLFALGYAGWGAGQLDRELQENAWLVADAGPDLVFHTDPDQKWERAVRTLGIDPLMLSEQAGNA